MGTILTTTQAAPVTWPSLPSYVRDPTSGYHYALVRNTAGGYEIRDSVDGGNNWTSLGSMTRASIVDFSSIVVDRNDWLHFAYRTNESNTDRLYYRRFNIDTGVLSSELLIASNANGGVAGTVWQGLDIAVVRNSNGSYAIAVVGAFVVGTTKYGVILNGVSITTDGTIYLNHGIIQNVREWWSYGTSPGRTTPSIEVEHTGDGFYTTTPHLWITWGRTAVHMVKVAWVGSTGWQGPNSHITITSPVPAQDYLGGRWDGSRFLMGSITNAATSTVTVYERDRANSRTYSYTTPVHPTGVIRQIALSYDRTKSDIRVFAVGTSTTVLYYVDYIRATSTWTTWATVSATALVGTGGNQFSTRRGGTHGNARYNVLTAHATPSPNTVVSTAMTATYAPSTPLWNTAAQPYDNGGAADVATSLTLDWDFVHPDPEMVQASYSLSRQIGAGALSYWRASDSTWQATEQTNSTATTSLTLASGWAVATDAQYQYKVKVRDTAGGASGYSAGLVLIPSAKVNPAITSPTAAQVLQTSAVTMTWTAAEQTAFQVILDQTSPTAQTRHDSGWLTSTALSYTVPYVMPDATGWTIRLTTKNNEGLASTQQTRAFTVSIVPPATPTLVVSGLPSVGAIRVAITNPTPGGAQPNVTTQDLYRRVVGDTSTGLRVAANLTSGATFDDKRAVALKNYEYRTLTSGTNGTSVYSAWTS